MVEEKKLTNEQVVVQDLVNQLQEKEAIIINLRVQITQLKLALTATKESVESIESVEKKSAKDKAEEK
jgi:hypothetical protein